MNNLKLRKPLYRDLWATFDLFGHRAYADSGLALVGEPPSKDTEELARASSEKLEKALARRNAQMSITKKTTEHVFFDEIDLPIDIRYYRHVLTEYPKAEFHKPLRGDAGKPIPIKSEGKIVGAVMCMGVV